MLEVVNRVVENFIMTEFQCNFMSIYAFCLHTAFPPLSEDFNGKVWAEVKLAISKIFLKKEAALDSLDCLPLIEVESTTYLFV